MLASPYTIGDLIKHMDNEEIKKVLSASQIAIIKDALTVRWTFEPKAPKAA